MTSMPNGAPSLSVPAAPGEDPFRHNLVATLAQHDAAITALGGRMSGVETGLRTLQGEVHSGFTSLASKLDRLDAAPKFDFHKTVSTVTTIAVLFSMIVGGIIWITTSQFSGVVAKQEAVNERDQRRLDWQAAEIAKINEKLGWVARVEPKAEARR
ncbi:MAG: hypothetical protein JSS20_12780 [Proteobacteria bacterium]|nr:hypothetical protein [Pseudomonadota bacterium]